MVSKEDIGFCCATGGAVIGIAGGIIIGANLIRIADSMKIFRYTDDLKIVRTYEVLKSDNILVFPDSTLEGINYERHLESIPDEYDRRIERARIEKLVGW
ncbi:MAG: hypothetical protein ABIH25_04295 [Candidatus Woesearchaeota archaeon]